MDENENIRQHGNRPSFRTEVHRHDMMVGSDVIGQGL